MKLENHILTFSDVNRPTNASAAIRDGQGRWGLKVQTMVNGVIN